MKLVLAFLASISVFNVYSAEIFCSGDKIFLGQLQEHNVDILEVLYSNGKGRNYTGRLCGVEDTDQLCFTGNDKDAAELIESYYKFTYQYDDEINGFFAKQSTKYSTKSNASVLLHYREQWTSYVFEIFRCDEDND